MADDIQAINDNIINNFEKDQKKTIRRMSKAGFIVIDGVIHQYSPGNTTFIEVSNGYYNGVYNSILKSLGNYWGVLTPMDVKELLQNELPNITVREANDFVKYQEQSQVIINEPLIQDLTKKAITENKQLQRLNMDFKGKKDLISQITVLRNNNIFVSFNARINRLYKFQDGEFLRLSSNDVQGILNEAIADGDIIFNIHAVKNNYNHYASNLTNVSKLVGLLRIKKRKNDAMKNCKPGFDKVMKIISKYGGKK